MRRAKEFDNILNECLERLFKGEAVDQCLALYPEQAMELKPLLETALVAKKASVIQPRPEFRERARNQFRAALQAAPARKGFFALAWPRWATAVAVVLVLLLAGGGTVAVANNSLPGNLLYGVKLATEQVWLAFTPSSVGKAELYAKLADRRVAEIVSIADKGDPEALDEAASRLDAELAMIITLAGGQTREAGGAQMEMAKEAPALAPQAPAETAEEDNSYTQDYTQDDSLSELRTTLERYAVTHPEALREMLKTVPESARPALLRAIDIAEAGYQQALEAVATQGR
jgi:hypothetical protein